MQKLVLTPFGKALESLEEVLRLDQDDDVARDATIHRFKYTYELAWKMIKRHLDWLGQVPPESLFGKREFAAKVGLIDDAERWFDYHRARNETSHTYDAAKAEEVFSRAVRFAPEAKQLLARLSYYHD